MLSAGLRLFSSSSLSSSLFLFTNLGLFSSLMLSSSLFLFTNPGLFSSLMFFCFKGQPRPTRVLLQRGRAALSLISVMLSSAHGREV